jgi:hypothetical protein
VLVPVANPIGLAQQLHYQPQGRFDLETGENFNRLYSEPSAQIIPQLAQQLTADVDANRSIIRQACAAPLPARPSTANCKACARPCMCWLSMQTWYWICIVILPVRFIFTHIANTGRWWSLAAHLQCGVSLLADEYG